MSIVSGTVGAILGSKAQKKAAETNAQAQRDVNAAQIAWQKQLLGEGGSPVFLPLYAKEQEQKIFADATAAYNAAINAGGTPEQAMAAAKIIADDAAATLKAGTGDVLSGQYLARQLENEAPVAAARTDLATGQKTSVLDSLSQRLNAVKADSARAGFTGGSSFTNARMLGATIGARQDAANITGQAKLANALARAGIQNEGAKLKLQTQFQAPATANSLLSLGNAPAGQLLQKYGTAASIYNPFRRPGSGPLAIQAPQVPVVPSPYQALAASAAQAGSTALDFYLKNQYAKSLSSGSGGLDLSGASSLGATNLFDTSGGGLEYLA